MAYNIGQYKVRIVLGIIVIILAIVFALIVREGSVTEPSGPSGSISQNQSPIATTTTSSTTPIKNSAATDIPALTIMTTGLTIPWDFAFLPDESILITERPGNLVHLGTDGMKTSIKLPHPVPRGEGGLLGITLHPDFALNNYLYLYMTTQSALGGTQNSVFRYRYVGRKLTEEKTIIASIPGARYHDGGRMEFGPDRLLYITTGDAQTPSIAQDPKSLGGKILRLTDEGSIPADNPFGTAVYSFGHRNPQGLAWDNTGRLWSTEHGRSGLTSGMDEINLIEKGANYGWPTIEGDATKTGMRTPILHSGATSTWAPASLLHLKGKLFFGGLLGASLYEVRIDETGTKVTSLTNHFKNQYGRIRTVRLGPDGMIYFTTSNRDGRGSPVTEDDRLVRVNPANL